MAGPVAAAVVRRRRAERPSQPVRVHRLANPAFQPKRQREAGETLLRFPNDSPYRQAPSQAPSSGPRLDTVEIRRDPSTSSGSRHRLVREQHSRPALDIKKILELRALCRSAQWGVNASRYSSLLPDLRTDHAGETGAVSIYNGILYVYNRRANSQQVQKDEYVDLLCLLFPHPSVHCRHHTLQTHRRSRQQFSDLISFARQHLQTEKQHLDLMDRLVPREHRSRLLPLWRVAGWMTGALPAFFSGDRGVYLTISAVESFVENHYQQQLAQLSPKDALYKVLQSCCEDEVEHQRDAIERYTGVTAQGKSGSGTSCTCAL